MKGSYFVFNKIIFILFLSAVLSGCKNGISDLSHQELASKNDQCVTNEPTAPGRVTACENIKKECLKRRKQGVHFC